MRRALLLAFLTVFGTATLRSQDLSGIWAGLLDLSETQLLLVFNIAEADDGYTATMDSPDQGVSGVPVDVVSFTDGLFRMEVTEIGMVYTGALQDDGRIEGLFAQSGYVFPLNLERAGYTINRPQEPQAPFPYNSEDVTIENTRSGIRLAGTLTYPTAGKKAPAVVLIADNGAYDRDGEIMYHKPLLVIADYLTRRGIAVLRMDSRGAGSSEGDFLSSTARDVSSDVEAAVAFLKTRREVNGKKIGLLGQGTGGMIAFMTAGANPKETAFVVSMAGTAFPGDSIMLMQVAEMVRKQGFPEHFVEVAVANQREDLDFLYGNTQEFVAEYIDDVAAKRVNGFAFLNDDAKNAVRAQIETSNSNWSRFYISYDPAADIRSTRCPVLAINGANDTEVQASANLEAIEKLLKEGGNSLVTVKIYEGLNHLFQPSVTGLEGEYAEIEETVSPQVLEDIADWILKVAK